MPPIVKKGMLKRPQLRVLKALIGERGEANPMYCRAELAEKANYTELSGTLWRALNGLREGSSSGAAHPGLLQMGMVARHDINIDGYKDTLYEITEKGVRAFWEYCPDGMLPEVRNRAVCVNKRYLARNA